MGIIMKEFFLLLKVLIALGCGDDEFLWIKKTSCLFGINDCIIQL